MGHNFLMNWLKINKSLTVNNHAIALKSNKEITFMVKHILITDWFPNRDHDKHNVFKFHSDTVCQENGQLPCKGS